MNLGYREANRNDSLAQLHLAAGRYELAKQAAGQSVKTLETGGSENLLAESLTTQGLVLCTGSLVMVAYAALPVAGRPNLREKGHVRDRDELKQMAQAIYLAEDRKQARAGFRCFKLRWQAEYPEI